MRAVRVEQIVEGMWNTRIRSLAAVVGLSITSCRFLKLRPAVPGIRGMSRRGNKPE